jgi:Uma2 family endonuclease
MSAIAGQQSSLSLLTATDPYYYGFRDEPELQPDGSFRSRRIELTLRDQLHPHEGDHFVEDSLHDISRGYLRDIFSWRVRTDPSALVLSNTGIYWDIEELGHHAPDVAVIFGVRQQRPMWPSFDVRKQGTRPRVIVELVSPRYRDNDVEEKVQAYHQARVPVYVILDRERDGDPWSIQAYQRRPQNYVPLPLEDDGRLWLLDLNLWLGVRGQQIRCFDGDTGEELGDLEAYARKAAEETARADAALARADAEKARADTAEARAMELEAELARLKGSSRT